MAMKVLLHAFCYGDIFMVSFLYFYGEEGEIVFICKFVSRLWRQSSYLLSFYPGTLKDTFGGYEQALYFAGITLFIAGFITFLIPLQKHFCKENPEGNETTSGRKCAQYNMAKIESSSSMKKTASQVESMEVKKRETEGGYIPVENTSNSPEHRQVAGVVADGLGGEGGDEMDDETIQVSVSEIENKGFESEEVKFD